MIRLQKYVTNQLISKQEKTAVVVRKIKKYLIDVQKNKLKGWSIIGAPTVANLMKDYANSYPDLVSGIIGLSKVDESDQVDQDNLKRMITVCKVILNKSGNKKKGLKNDSR